MVTHKQKTIIVSLSIFLVLLGVSLFVVLYQPAREFFTSTFAGQVNATKTLDLRFNPVTITGNVGDTLDVNLMMNSNGSKATILSGILSFDSKAISITSVEKGSYFSQTVVAPIVENNTVKFTFAVAPDSGGKSANTDILRLKIKLLKSGTTGIMINESSQGAIVGVSSNAIRNRTPLTIKIR